jgi:hypothetical protein
MSPVDYYLRFPKEYFQWLAFQSPQAPTLTTLRWSASGEAIEYENGHTFAFGAEIALFVEGFATGAPLISFAHMLHALYILRPGNRAASDDLAVLSHAFTKTGGHFRNAGALIARLCGAVPAYDEPVDVGELCRHLSSAFLMVEAHARIALFRRQRPAVCPALGPERFEARLREALRELSPAEVEHWLRHGRGSLEEPAKEIARELTRRPRSLTSALAALARRPRIAGAVSLVPHLRGALTLPPRRLAHQELAVGGYADVATRGHPEHLLPQQFALDSMEFLRRLAEHEMLYFRREEPHARVSEDLVVLLDQGVRTWGDVRLVLSAAVLALGKMSVRKRIPFRVAATSAEGKIVDPLQEEEELLGEMLETSDLTADPGIALERVLEEPSTVARDVVLLTHPRNLLEENVLAAAHRVTPNMRLFAVAVDGEGRVSLSEIRHGTVVKLKQFRLDLSAPRTSLPPVEPSPVDAGPSSAWQGDVEPVGFPFRFGVRRRILHFDFDNAGEWIAAGTEGGLLYVWKLDGSRMEVLPRAMVHGTLFTGIQALLGVAGGFVAAGFLGKRLAAAHYDFERRFLTVHVLGVPSGGPWVWYYFRQVHCIVAVCRQIASSRMEDWCLAVDLSTGERFPAQEAPANSRAAQACALVQEFSVPPPGVGVYREDNERTAGPSVYLDKRTGAVTLKGVNADWPPFTPLADGRPILNAVAVHARYAGDTLALGSMIDYPNGGSDTYAVRLFRGPEGSLVREYPGPRTVRDFTLSSDGRFFARQIGSTQLAIDDVAAGGAPILVTTKGKAHHKVEMQLRGPHSLTVGIGGFRHVIDWTGGCLSINREKQKSLWDLSVQMMPMKSRTLPPLVSYDLKRFLTVARCNVIAVGDEHGQIAVLDEQSGDLVCMFFVFRSQVAAWMPDGTRWGPASLTGGPATSNAEQKIGRALWEASRPHWEPRL